MGTPQSAMLRSQGKLSRRKVVTRSSLSNQRYLSLRLDQQSKYVYIHCTYLYCDCTVCSSLASVYNKCTSNFFSSLRENLQHEESCECCRLGMMLLNLLSVRSARLVSLTWTVCLQSSPVRKMTGDFEVTCLLSTCTCIPYSW